MDSSALNLPNAYREKLAPIQTLTPKDEQTARLTAIEQGLRLLATGKGFP